MTAGSSGAFSVQPGESVDSAVRHLTSVLSGAGVDSPASDARALACLALGVTAGDLVSLRLSARVLDDDEAARLSAAGARRAAREPLQHVVGTAPFRHLDVAVGPGCLVPRPETELLVDCVLDFLSSPLAPAGRDRDVLDVGTGSGAIAASVASEAERVRVTAVDVSPEALVWAAQNAAPLGVRVLEADAMVPRPEFDRAFDVVVSNPPYVPEDVRPTQPEALADPPLALYGGSPDGLAIPVAVAQRAAEWLRPGGFLAMEHAESQGESLREELGRLGFTDCRTHQDLTGRDRMTTARLPGT